MNINNLNSKEGFNSVTKDHIRYNKHTGKEQHKTNDDLSDIPQNCRINVFLYFTTINLSF